MVNFTQTQVLGQRDRSSPRSPGGGTAAHWPRSTPDSSIYPAPRKTSNCPPTPQRIPGFHHQPTRRKRLGALLIPGRRPWRAAREIIDWDNPGTATTRGAGYLVQTIASNFIAANRNHNVPRSIEEPIPTATTATGGGSFLIEAKPKPFMLGQQSSSAPRTTDHPTPTVATAGAISIVQPSIILYYGQSNAQPIEAPVTAITSCRKHALMSPTLIPCESQTDHDTKPAAALIELNHGNGDLGHQGNNRRVHSLDEPMPAITTSPGMAIVQPSFIQPDNAQTMDTREYQDIVDELISNDIDPRRLVIIDGQPYLLDILFRMLQNRELSRAMGFDDDDSQYEFVGNISEVTKQIGNAVPVKMAAALVKTILST